MALSNRDRVGKAFEVLRDGLLPFIEQVINAMASGADWAGMMSAAQGKQIDREDVQTHLQLLTSRFNDLFKEQLPYAARNYASELRDYRNSWAHLKAFNNDDTYRMLETAERLLTLTGSVAAADEVRKSRVDHQRRVFESETRKLAHSQETTSVAGQGLKPWREVLAPHDDVASGTFSASEFAADLHMVAFPTAESGVGREYADPVEFFRRTYLTAGLRDLLDRALRRVDGDANASPIINLQTNFGGGKTHSMLALWHLFSGIPVKDMPQDMQDLAQGHPPRHCVRRVVLVGTHLSPGSASVKPDGTEVATLWGELAWQLGGADAYAMVAEADRARTNPGTELRGLIEAHAPCVILIDEWVAYARQLWGREDLIGGTFDTQFTFAQSLTEVVKTVPGALLVISIPASHDPEKDSGSTGSAIEVGGPNGQEALARLQNVVRRVADQWRPASSQESFEIVRRRLFHEPDADALADIAAVARQFVQFYQRHPGEFPKGVSEPSYEARIKAAYPLHPELFDRLYEDWSTLERFQRTRGVLRLMSTVVHALWVRQDSAPIILPGTVPLDVSTVATEIIQYLPDSWRPIVDADIDGPTSTPAGIDAERSTLGQRMVTKRLARTIFIGSAPTLRSGNRGIERPQVWLGTAMPGDVPGNYGSALDLMNQRATYLYADGQRYWFDTQASITRTAADYAEGLRDKPELVWAEIASRLSIQSRQRGGFSAVSAAVESSAEVPDQEEVRLVILHPSLVHTKGAESSDAMLFAREAFERRGTAQRANRNMVVFLAPDAKRMDELTESTRHYLAWTSVAQRTLDLDLSPQQVAQVEANQRRNDEDVTARIAQSYHWLIVPDQFDPAAPATLTPEKAEGSNSSLAIRATEKLGRLGLLAESMAARAVRVELDAKLPMIWQAGHVKVGDLWGYYCRYPYLTRMRDRRVLADAITSVLSSVTWQIEGFAVADGFDDATGRYVGLVLPSGDAHLGTITDNMLLVAPDVALAQSAAERPDPTADGSADGTPESTKPSAPATSDDPPATTRYFGVVQLDPHRYARDFTQVSQEVLQPLAAVADVDLEVTVEIRARAGQGFSADKIRVVLENANTLKFGQSAFETD